MPQLPAEYSEKMHAMKELHRRTSDEDEASDKVNDMDSDEIVREVKNGPGIDYTDDVEWTVDSVDTA